MTSLLHGFVSVSALDCAHRSRHRFSKVLEHAATDGSRDELRQVLRLDRCLLRLLQLRRLRLLALQGRSLHGLLDGRPVHVDALAEALEVLH